MTDRTCRRGSAFEFSLPDAGSGGESRSAAELAADHASVVVILLRDHYCPRSRRLVMELADGYDPIAGRSASIVPIHPGKAGRAAIWQRRYDLPFALLADPAGEGGSAADGSTSTAFDAFAPFENYVEQLPGVVLFDATTDELRFVRTIGRETLLDADTVDLIGDALDDLRDGDVAGPKTASVGPETVGGS